MYVSNCFKIVSIVDFHSKRKWIIVQHTTMWDAESKTDINLFFSCENGIKTSTMFLFERRDDLQVFLLLHGKMCVCSFCSQKCLCRFSSNFSFIVFAKK